MNFSYYHFILALEAASLVSTTMPSAVYAQKSGGHLRNRRDIIKSPPEYSATSATNNDLRRLSDTQSCFLGLEDVMPLLDAPRSSIKDHVFTCVMDSEEEDATFHPGHMFDLDMDADDEEFLEKLFDDGTIIPGQFKLDVQGLEYDEENIFIPKGWDIATKISNGTKKSPPWKSNRLRRHAQENNIYEDRNLKTGDRKVLVVKVVTPELRNSTTNEITCEAPESPAETYPSTSQRPESLAEISSIIFGEGPTGVANSNVNMKDQLSACSFGKMNMIPTDGDDPINAPGVITLNIEKSLCNHRNRFRDDARIKLEERLGRPPAEVYDHVIFLMEKCVQNCGWAAFAGSNSWYSFYQNINYKIPAVVMHELGHNFNLAHSGGLDGSTYSDKTGFMGNPAHASGARYAGNLCYDAAKSWQLGWYNDRDRTLYPENESSTWGTVKTMVGIANYDQASSETPVLIKLETGLAEDYFINFNRATGINQQNVQADDEVTIVKANADTKSQSYLQATLPVNESHTIVGLGKANGIVVKLLSIDKTDHDLWKAEVFIGTDQATIPGPTTPQPTRSPSTSPTLSPSASPITAEPSNSPSKGPSSSPSQSPSLSPSKGPSKAPQLNPTTASPSTSPSVHPSKAPSDSPSDQPSSQPTTSMPTLSSSSMAPTLSPTTPAPVVTKEPTSSPSLEPTSSPSRGPTSSPSQSPSASPSQSPTSIPSQSPSTAPSKAPTVSPTLAPSRAPSTSPSANPTQSPTTESPTYGSTPVQQHYTACGSSRKSCAGKTELADAEDLHEVRCCSDTDLGDGWVKRSGCDVWGESHINGVCHRGKTYTEAVDICTSVGARLCTAQELLDDCPRGTGCNFDREMNWSSTPGIEQEVTEYEYEAEYYSNGSGVSVKTTHAGYTGSGFVDYGGSGTYIEINNVNGGSGGVCSISTNYANGGSWTRTCKVSVNGVDQPGELSYQPTGAWNKWADSNTLQVNCNPGTSNTIRITGITSGPNMNKMMVSVP